MSDLSEDRYDVGWLETPVTCDETDGDCRPAGFVVAGRPAGLTGGYTGATPAAAAGVSVAAGVVAAATGHWLLAAGFAFAAHLFAVAWLAARHVAGASGKR